MHFWDFYMSIQVVRRGHQNAVWHEHSRLASKETCALEPNGGHGYRCFFHINSIGAIWAFCTDVCFHRPLPMERLAAGTTFYPSTVSQNFQIRKDPVFRLCFLMSSVCKDVVLYFTQKNPNSVWPRWYSLFLVRPDLGTLRKRKKGRGERQ